MAKKKQKQNNHSSKKGSNKHKDSPRSRLECSARESYRERTKCIRHDETLTPELREGLDYDPIRQKRRIRATIATMEEVKKRVQHLCPDVPDIYSTEEEWIEINAFPSPAYDYEERFTFSALASAIWMLDQIRDSNRMKKLEAVLPIADSVDEIIYPPVWDPCHGNEVLYNMMHAILHRNDPDLQSGEGSSGNVKIQRFYMTESLAEQKVSSQWKKRMTFDSILALIPSEAVDAAEQMYQEKYWDFVTRYFLSRQVVCRMDVKLKADIDDFERRSSEILSAFQDKQAEIARTVPAPQIHPLQLWNHSKMEIPMQSAATEYQQMFAKVQSIDAERMRLESREVALNDLLDSFGKEMWAITSKPNSYLERKYGKEIAAIWKDFEISDPYAMCFAFMSLLDKGSDLPWCYCAGVNLHACYAASLPWPRMKFHPYNDGIWYHCKPDQEGFSFGPDGSELPKKIRIPEFDDWTKLQFEDKMADDSDDVEKFNLSHIMYELTGCIMPRKMDRYIPALKILDRYGIRGKKTLPLLYCASALGEARHRSSLSLFDRLLESLENESEEEAADEQSAEEMKSQIKSLQAEVKRLKEASYEAGREVQEERLRYESLAQKAANDAQELHDLRELMFNQQNDLYDAQETAVDISFPYQTSRRIIVFGGHDSWCKEMKPKFPDIRFIDREMLPNPDMIRRADEIWIQTNALSHKHFYRIIDEVRKYNIPLRYFAYSGVSKCAEQFVREDKKVQ